MVAKRTTKVTRRVSEGQTACESLAHASGDNVLPMNLVGQRANEIISESAEDFAREMRSDWFARSVMFRAESAEAELTRAEDQQFVIRPFVAFAMRRIGSQLHGTAVRVDFDWRDRLEQVGELRGKMLGADLQVFNRFAGQLLALHGQVIHGAPQRADAGHFTRQAKVLPIDLDQLG